jgi:lipopolysaccharide assembly outer membrane protein LptD (OstA)
MRAIRLFQITALLLVILCPAFVSAAASDVIKADKTYYDANTGLYILEGHIVLHIKDAIVQAPRARISLAQLEVYADGGITVSKEGFTFRGDSVYVKGKERRAIIQGNVHLEDDGLVVNCSSADFNWKTKIAKLYDATIIQNGCETKVDEAIYNVKYKTLDYNPV